jgi:hypothetical protein
MLPPVAPPLVPPVALPPVPVPEAPPVLEPLVPEAPAVPAPPPVAPSSAASSSEQLPRTASIVSRSAGPKFVSEAMRLMKILLGVRSSSKSRIYQTCRKRANVERSIIVRIRVEPERVEFGSPRFAPTRPSAVADCRYCAIVALWGAIKEHGSDID